MAHNIEERPIFPEIKQSHKQSGKLLLILEDHIFFSVKITNT